MKRLEARWLQEVQQSRLVIRADETSYLAELNLPLSRVVQGLREGLLDEELMRSYPGLTEADIRVCDMVLKIRTRDFFNFVYHEPIPTTKTKVYRRV